VEKLGDGLTRAADWLRAQQSRNGAWRDFWTPSGASDEWITAYVGSALALANDAATRAAAVRAWSYLEMTQHSDGGWGYTASVPSDADSTSWALVLAQRIGKGSSRCARKALAWLQSARRPGGMPTYRDAGEIREYVQAPPSMDFSGWTQVHACVTAVAAQVRPLSALLVADVRAHQQADGSWRGYWWFEDSYATAMSVAALASSVPSLRQADASVEHAGCWAQRQLKEGVPSPFSLSLLVMIRLAAGEHSKTELAAYSNALANGQQSDGRWRGAALLRIPRPDTLEPASVRSWQRWCGSPPPFNVYSPDQCDIFTTATAYLALQTMSRGAARDVIVH
jgi:hypothetical protein